MRLKIQIQLTDDNAKREYEARYGIHQPRISAEVVANNESELQECFNMLSERICGMLGMC